MISGTHTTHECVAVLIMTPANVSGSTARKHPLEKTPDTATDLLDLNGGSDFIQFLFDGFGFFPGNPGFDHGWRSLY